MNDRRRWWPLFALLFACNPPVESTPAPPPIEQPDPPAEQPGPCTTPACTPLDPVLPYSGMHRLDAAVHETLTRAGINFEPAGALELCRRLSADLLGKLPTREEFMRDCAGRAPEVIIADFQSRDRYLLTAQRVWQDRLATNDVYSDWRYQKSLYLLVDELQRGTLRYDDFAAEVLSHPGFVLMDFLPEYMAAHAFRAFLGRQPAAFEAFDLAGMFRPWLASQIPDIEFPSIYRFAGYLMPSLCEPITDCSTTLFGGAELNLPWTPFTIYVPYEELSPLQHDALKGVGRLFARQPLFWETQADAMLSRFLGWSDGGRSPREPGTILPELRQALADYLRETGDIPGAEKLILTSRLYLQKTIVEPDGWGDDPKAPSLPVYAYGPVKAVSAETWLDSIAPLTFIDLGTCDPRFPDYYAYLQLYDAFDQGIITSTAALEENFLKLSQMQESRAVLSLGYYGIAEPNTYYTYYARQLGGCPGFGSPRGAPSGLAFGFAQETFAELACTYAYNAVPPGLDASTDAVIAHQMNILYGRTPSDEESALIKSALNTCSGEDCTQGGIARSLCTAFTGSSELLFY